MTLYLSRCLRWIQTLSSSTAQRGVAKSNGSERAYRDGFLRAAVYVRAQLRQITLE